MRCPSPVQLPDQREHGIRILARAIGKRRKKDEEAEKDIRNQNHAVLVGKRCSESIFDKRLDEWFGLIWSDRVNSSGSVGLFLQLSLLLLFPEDRASSSLGRFERRLISLIFAGRDRIIMIRRELPLTLVIASPVEPVA